MFFIVTANGATGLFPSPVRRQQRLSRLLLASWQRAALATC
jgi:hypothetical protein